MASIPVAGEVKFRCPNMLSLVSFAGMTLNKCAVLRIGTLTGGPLCRESHPMCWLKNPTVVYMITCRLSSCKTDVYNVRLLIILERECRSTINFLNIRTPNQFVVIMLKFLSCKVDVDKSKDKMLISGRNVLPRNIMQTNLGPLGI